MKHKTNPLADKQLNGNGGGENEPKKIDPNKIETPDEEDSGDDDA